MCSLSSLQHFFHTYKQTDIFAVTETHIDKGISNASLYEITEYDLYVKIGVYVKI